MNEWQPIETAPKDGTRVLWYLDFHDGYPAPGYVVGHWRDDAKGFCICTDGENGTWHERGAIAWMPLPEPPK